MNVVPEEPSAQPCRITSDLCYSQKASREKKSIYMCEGLMNEGPREISSSICLNATKPLTVHLRGYNMLRCKPRYAMPPQQTLIPNCFYASSPDF